MLESLCQADFGEIEESCLLVCHFYLPKEKSDIYMGTLRLTLLPEAVLAPEATTPPGGPAQLSLYEPASTIGTSDTLTADSAQ
jgi:hypothetical protein